MFDILPIAAIVGGMALIVLLAAKVGLGSTGWVDSILVMPTMPARPRGTQENDLPPFVFRDAASADAPATPRRVVVGRDREAVAA